RETRAAAAGVRARRASVSADRVALNAHGGQRGRAGDPAQLPLARVMAADDAVTARWMEYETDAARQLAFPTLGDARVQTTAAFLAELQTTRALRPPSADARITPAQFTAYRDGVARLTRAFDAAEAEAWRIARREGSAPAGAGRDTAAPSAWITSAQEIAQNLTQSVLARGAEALARATAPRETDPRQAPPKSAPKSAPQSAPRDDPRRNPTPADAAPPPAGTEPPPPTGRGDEASDAAPKPPIWPIPSRGTRPPRP
ncbi:hypothetical protein, partial [Microbacterium lacticum]|uniref:hypothetical protein n=1 Tax=Microbacterium lacticum TaxID=33885 RepID=UPI0028D88633